MTVFLVDSSVLLDVVTDDPIWADWAQQQLDTASRVGDMVINPMIYAEVSLAYASVEDLDAGVAAVGLGFMVAHIAVVVVVNFPQNPPEHIVQSVANSV